METIIEGGRSIFSSGTTLITDFSHISKGNALQLFHFVPRLFCRAKLHYDKIGLPLEISKKKIVFQCSPVAENSLTFLYFVNKIVNQLIYIVFSTVPSFIVNMNFFYKFAETIPGYRFLFSRQSEIFNQTIKALFHFDSVIPVRTFSLRGSLLEM